MSPVALLLLGLLGSLFDRIRIAGTNRFASDKENVFQQQTDSVAVVRRKTEGGAE
jgi:hypothetical protein